MLEVCCLLFMLVNHTTIRLDPAQRERAMDLITELVEYSRTEDGTVRYQAMTDISDPDIVRFFEQYEDTAAAEAHTDSEQYRQFVESLPELVDGNIETIQITTNSIESAEFTPMDAVEGLD